VVPNGNAIVVGHLVVIGVGCFYATRVHATRGVVAFSYPVGGDTVADPD
jgi:hypothetical protein